MKNFTEATEKEISYLRSHPCEIIEKLDMIYFKVVISESGLSVFNSKNKEITQVDCIVNSVYNNIMNYVHDVIAYRTDDILEMFGPCRIGIFYHPVARTNVISYNSVSYKFILCDFYTDDKSKNDEQKLSDLLALIERPLIKRFESLPEFSYTDPESVINILTDGKTWSGNGIDDIEGIIIQSPKYRFQIVETDTTSKLEKESKKLYRDTVLENLANVVFDQNIDVATLKGNDYVEKACSLFLEYITKTNLMSKMYIEPEDLLPPTSGYIGDLVLTRLPSTVRLICKGNSIYKNILRIILVTFNRSVYENKFKDFSPQVREKLTKILIGINS
jgi:hypothetical protein